MPSSTPTRARVYVTPRADVRDPQGDAVRDALRALGFHEVEAVRVGRYLELSLAAPGDAAEDAAGAGAPDTRARVQAMCDALLANPVVEDARVELVGQEPPAASAEHRAARDTPGAGRPPGTGPGRGPEESAQ